MDVDFETRASWRKHKKLVKRGFKDLMYLPRSRTGWNATLSAYAFSVRRSLAGEADLDLWATMHASPASVRYAELGKHALVLWHGTSAERGAKIETTGLFHKRGLWTTLDPKIAHGYARSRGSAFQAGSAMIVLVLDRREFVRDVHYEQRGPSILRFHRGLPAEAVEYILFDDRVEFTGERKAKHPKAWGVARFKKVEGTWMPRSKPPVRLDAERTYQSFDQWLTLSVRRILDTLGSACAIEIFSSLYATIDPTDALEHDHILETCERLCGKPKQRKGFKQFRLKTQ